MSVKVKINGAGVREVLSSGAVRSLTYSKAQEVAGRACAACDRGLWHHTEPIREPYTAHPGSGSQVGIANVATSSYQGMVDQSVNHTLQKLGGV